MPHPRRGRGGVGTSRASAKHSRGDALGISCVGLVQPWGCWGVLCVTLRLTPGMVVRVSGHLVCHPSTAMGMLWASHALPCVPLWRRRDILCVAPVQPWGCWGIPCITLAWPRGCQGALYITPLWPWGCRGTSGITPAADATASSPGASLAETLSPSTRRCSFGGAWCGSDGARLFGTSPELYGSQTPGLPRRSPAALITQIWKMHQSQRFRKRLLLYRGAQGVWQVTARARMGHGAACIPSVLRARTAPWLPASSATGLRRSGQGLGLVMAPRH